MFTLYNQHSTPSAVPSENPSQNPSAFPSLKPSNSSSPPSTSLAPSGSPSLMPSTSPSHQPSTPSATPSENPSQNPSAFPSHNPSNSSSLPSTAPIKITTMVPSGQPSPSPASEHEDHNSVKPSGTPSRIPTIVPSSQPSSSPLYVPSTTPSSIPDIVVETFIEDFGLVENATLTFQQISSQNMFVYNNKIFHLDEAVPFTLSSPDAIYLHNGVSSKNFPRPNIVKLEDNEDIVTIRKHADREVKTIYIVNKDTGTASEIQNIHPGILATIQTGDYAEVPFILAEDETDFTRTEKRPKMTRANSEDLSDQNEECSRYSVLELAVAYESSFCAYYGRNATRADEGVVSIVSLVSSRYQQRNLCVKVVLSYLEGYCDPDVDPYKEAVDLGESGCSGPGLTTFFQNYWNANKPTIRRGVANLFSGSMLECKKDCVAGCAYKSTMCNKS